MIRERGSVRMVRHVAPLPEVVNQSSVQASPAGVGRALASSARGVLEGEFATFCSQGVALKLEGLVVPDDAGVADLTRVLSKISHRIKSQAARLRYRPKPRELSHVRECVGALLATNIDRPASLYDQPSSRCGLAGSQPAFIFRAHTSGDATLVYKLY